MTEQHYKTCIIVIALVIGIILGIFVGYNLKVIKPVKKIETIKYIIF